MLLGKKRKLGRQIDEISVGEKLSLTEKIEDKDLLLYLGLTNDANPLYIQHDYASQTPFQKPIVPSIMLTGIITAAVSKYMPGPGSHILKQVISFPKAVYHYGTVNFLFEVIEVNKREHTVVISVEGKDDEDVTVIQGEIMVCPPHRLAEVDGSALDNF
ncbi:MULTISPECIES: MaoC/PaaZ C-terminal domain-containing protein [unclassified Bacillus (in: firmicutes)]|uniref:MaoC/PaaZ C-terminal domain-containing protein n=1 Tax=unclassified Bacillus (in: firmicutes) TaxID=185979 RepID=UPI0008E50AAB|nr:MULTISPECIES: MaoC/PaaZ C-terminal domain-containing protein [unclassified Bacillus (in: firmicutes)]SFB17257.1 Acyl dehydratase [Bacillus sp. UNCCL13]SFQ77345.1 Acyl dehydratase [Bacillus sp. cl95]